MFDIDDDVICIVNNKKRVKVFKYINDMLYREEGVYYTHLAEELSDGVFNIIGVSFDTPVSEVVND